MYVLYYKCITVLQYTSCTSNIHLLSPSTPRPHLPKIHLTISWATDEQRWGLVLFQQLVLCAKPQPHRVPLLTWRPRWRQHRYDLPRWETLVALVIVGQLSPFAAPLPAKVYKAFSSFCSKDQQIKYPSCTARQRAYVSPSHLHLHCTGKSTGSQPLPLSKWIDTCNLRD